MIDRRCLVEVPNAPRHRDERAYAETDYDEETALENYPNPTVPGLRVQLTPRLAD